MHPKIGLGNTPSKEEDGVVADTWTFNILIASAIKQGNLQAADHWFQRAERAGRLEWGEQPKSLYYRRVIEKSGEGIREEGSASKDFMVI